MWPSRTPMNALPTFSLSYRKRSYLRDPQAAFGLTVVVAHKASENLPRRLTVCGKSPLVVILSEVKNPSRFRTKPKRDSSREISAQNESVYIFSAVLPNFRWLDVKQLRGLCTLSAWRDRTIRRGVHTNAVEPRGRE